MEETEDRPRRRKADARARGLMSAIDNGIGLRLSRLMIIVGVPALSSLALYAFNTTMENVSMRIDGVGKATSSLSEEFKSVRGDVKELSDKITSAQLAIVGVQTRQDEQQRRRP